MKLDPDSFSTKLILNGIDKLVFTLLLALILAILAQCHTRGQMRTEQLHRIKVQRPIELLEELSHLIRHCTLLTKRASEHPLPVEDREKLVSLLLGIELKLGMIKNYSNDRKETGRIAGDLRMTVAAALEKPNITDNNLKELGETLNREFDSLFKRMIMETTKIIVDGKSFDEHRIILY